METMKLVLSRKGFDSVYGGVPSPILPDGRLCYLPIPGDNGNSTCCFSDIQRTDYDLANIVFDLTRGRLSGDNWVHLDPDLRKEDLPRFRGWRPCFGQTSVAQAHLDNMGVGPGDLFCSSDGFARLNAVLESGDMCQMRPTCMSSLAGLRLQRNLSEPI